MLSPMIDAVVFDFGGVFIASPFEAIRAAGEAQGASFDQTMAIVFGPYDLDTDHPWHRAERGELDIMSAREQIRDLGREQGFDIDLFEMMKNLASDGGVNEDMVALVRRVRAKGLRTALLTNNIAEGRGMWQGMLAIDELFDAAVDSSAIGMRKPDPRIYHHTLAEIGGVAPERSVFLDDYAGNITAANDVGMIGVLVEADPAEAIARVDELLATV
jgi:epoxide hydrolase-like predicted phosphatase